MMPDHAVHATIEVNNDLCLDSDFSALKVKNEWKKARKFDLHKGSEIDLQQEYIEIHQFFAKWLTKHAMK